MINWRFVSGAMISLLFAPMNSCGPSRQLAEKEATRIEIAKLPSRERGGLLGIDRDTDQPRKPRRLATFDASPALEAIRDRVNEEVRIAGSLVRRIRGSQDGTMFVVQIGERGNPSSVDYNTVLCVWLDEQPRWLGLRVPVSSGWGIEATTTTQLVFSGRVPSGDVESRVVILDMSRAKPIDRSPDWFTFEQDLRGPFSSFKLKAQPGFGVTVCEWQDETGKSHSFSIPTEGGPDPMRRVEVEYRVFGDAYQFPSKGSQRVVFRRVVGGQASGPWLETGIGLKHSHPVWLNVP